MAINIFMKTYFASRSAVLSGMNRDNNLYTRGLYISVYWEMQQRTKLLDQARAIATIQHLNHPARLELAPQPKSVVKDYKRVS
jgi:hypothetical protein